MKLEKKLKELSPFLILTTILLIYHLFVNTNKMDDAAMYGDLLDYTPLIPWLEYRYQTWTSRIFIDGAVVLLVEYNVWIFRILNIFCWVLFGYSISKLVPTKNDIKMNLIIILLLLLYPIYNLDSAGWCATNLNYLWPMALGTFAFTSLVQPAEVPFHWYHLIIYAFATLFACNQEQMCAIVFAVFFCYTIFLFIRKQTIPHKFFILSLLFISLSELIFILTCNGNQARKLIEIERWMPEYVDLTFIDKLDIGLTDTINRVMFHKQNLLFIIFAATLFFIIFLKTKKWYKILISALPLTISILGTYFNSTFDTIFPTFGRLLDGMRTIGHDQYTILDSFELLNFLFYCFIILCILLSLYFVSSDLKEFLLYLIVLGSATASHIVVGYSPSIYVSGDRTCLFLYGALIFCTAKSIYSNQFLHKNLIKTIITLLSVLAILCFLYTMHDFLM